MEQLTEAARLLRNAKDRERYKRDPQKQRERNIRYWNRKAARLAAAQVTTAATNAQEKNCRE